METLLTTVITIELGRYSRKKFLGDWIADHQLKERGGVRFCVLLEDGHQVAIGTRVRSKVEHKHLGEAGLVANAEVVVDGGTAGNVEAGGHRSVVHRHVGDVNLGGKADHHAVGAIAVVHYVPPLGWGTRIGRQGGRRSKGGSGSFRSGRWVVSGGGSVVR